MFLKRMRRRVGRKRLTCWALVESVRAARGQQRRVVAHLGELRAGERAGWAKLTSRLAEKGRPAPSLFDRPARPGRTARANHRAVPSAVHSTGRVVPAASTGLVAGPGAGPA
jgi:hypothetical protein